MSTHTQYLRPLCRNAHGVSVARVCVCARKGGPWSVADARRLDRETNGPGFAYPLTSTSTESYNRRFGIAHVATVEGGDQGDGGFVIPFSPYGLTWLLPFSGLTVTPLHRDLRVSVSLDASRTNAQASSSRLMRIEATLRASLE